jgi:hypothetical protein
MWKKHRIPFEPSERICNVCFGLDSDVAVGRAKEMGKLLDWRENTSRTHNASWECRRHPISIAKGGSSGDILRIIVPLSALVIAAGNDCSSCWMLVHGIKEITADRGDGSLEHDSFDRRDLSVVIAIVRRPDTSKQQTLKLTLAQGFWSDCQTFSGGPIQHIKQLEYYTLPGRFHFTTCAC